MIKCCLVKYLISIGYQVHIELFVNDVSRHCADLSITGSLAPRESTYNIDISVVSVNTTKCKYNRNKSNITNSTNTSSSNNNNTNRTITIEQMIYSDLNMRYDDKMNKYKPILSSISTIL